MSVVPTGRLILRIKNATLDRDTEWILKMDPYVMGRCGGMNKRTLACMGGGKTPTWNEVCNS